MAKRHQRERKRRPEYDEEMQENEFDAYGLKPETKRGIAAVVFVILASLTLLSLLNLAGTLGGYVTQALSLSFGITRWIVPVVLLVASYWFLSLKDERDTHLTYRILGTVLFILSLNALIHLLIIVPPDFYTRDMLATAGGYLGVALSLPLVSLTGMIAPFFILFGLMVISLLIVLNSSLESLGRRSFFWLRWVRAIARIRHYFSKQEEVYEEATETRAESDDSGASDTGNEPSMTRKSLSQEPAPEGSKSILVRRKKKKQEIPLDLLSAYEGKATGGNIEQIADKIQKSLQNFGIEVELGEVNVGPTVSQYTLKPADGIKLSRITGLRDDLALAIAAHPLRIEAPIPGKSLVGIEVPNESAAIVGLRELLASVPFKKRKSNLTIALGKDVSGIPWFANIDSMPHLLIAGATGSGKSICINAVINALLYQNSPDELKFIMVDPKRVELTIYNGIPHLITPVITEPKKTVNALKWCLAEMDRRFEVLSKVKKRDIGTYNAETEDQMPYIIVIIDELADIMATSMQEVEAAIIRLSQMARAVGIHLILATQRPSVNVITGLIKANITTRIAFSVASLMDSRTILDSAGAEKLIGRGDMLYVTPALSKPKRIQGVYISEKEIQRVVNHVKEIYEEPEYDETITAVTSSSGMGGNGDFDSEDELYEAAKRIVLESKKASASLLQRRLKVGYSRAARLVDMLEQQGIVGPADGAKPREILVDSYNVDDSMGESGADFEEFQDAQEDNDEELFDEEDDLRSEEDEREKS